MSPARNDPDTDNSGAAHSVGVVRSRSEEFGRHRPSSTGTTF